MLSILDLIKKETIPSIINLIAAENIAYPEVKQVLSSDLMDKRIEGLPGHRWYPGCTIADQIENYTIELVSKLFCYPYANVQPYSGSMANMAVYIGLLKAGDKVLSLGLQSGGHVSHGSKAHITSKSLYFHHYGLDNNEEIDYIQVEHLAKEHRPKLIIIGASSYFQNFNFKQFRQIADSVGALVLADISHISGLILAGIQESPAQYADIVTFDCHKLLRGPRGGVILWKDPNLSKNINLAVSPKLQGAAFGNVTAAKAVAFEKANSKEYISYIHNIVANTQILSKLLIKKGYKLVSGGTTNHMLSFNIGMHNYTGRELSKKFEEHGIFVQKNQLPQDTLGIMDASGIKVGMPYLTSQGITTSSVYQLADMLDYGIKSKWSDVLQLKQEIISTLHN